MDISRLLFALTTSTIILLGTAGIVALAIIAANEDSEKAFGKVSDGTMVELAKGILAAIKVWFFLAISVMVFIFVRYMI